MIELNEDQIYASYKAEDWYFNKPSQQVFEISGAAGTGKTTCVRYIIQKLGLELNEVLFVAYTGKAAVQLCRNGVPAKTIHSSFYYYEKVYELDEFGNRIKLDNGKYKKKFDFVLREGLPNKIKLIVIDEATMVNAKFRKDIESFQLPIIALGDLNQLPPVFGDSVFLNTPDVTLRKIMRQAENDPIVYLSQKVIHEEPIRPGVFGNSCVIRKQELNSWILQDSDIIITHTNKLRHRINKIFREDFYKFPNQKYPYVGEKVICKKNNWDKKVQGNIYLVNGLTGTLEYVDRESYNGKKIRVDFQPDFTTKVFRNLNISYKRLIENEVDPYDFDTDAFEFAYAITAFAAQGSQWEKVVVLKEDVTGDADFKKKLLYTQITRAISKLTLAI